jgi:flagellar biosynthesis protein FlhA
MGLVLVGLSYLIFEVNKAAEQEKAKAETEALTSNKKESIDSLLPLDLLELEVGYGLINVVEGKGSGSDLIERISSIRKQFALDLGIIVPSIHIRDNLALQPGEYRFLIKGNRVGGGVLKPDHLMAMDPGNVSTKIEGIPTKEPAFGLDALWISSALREEAELAGYTVVDLSTVIATHLTEVIRLHAHELLGRQEASQLIENFKKNFPKIVDDLIPEVMSLGSVVKVLQNLLREQISIRDLRTILETLADEGQKTKDVEVLTEVVRKALARTITTKFVGEDQSMRVLTLSPDWEEYIANNLLQTETGVQLVMDPKQAQRLINQVAQAIERHPEMAGAPILMTSPTARRHLYKLISRFLPQIIVLAHSELSQDVQIKLVESLELSHAS